MISTKMTFYIAKIASRIGSFTLTLTLGFCLMSTKKIQLSASWWFFGVAYLASFVVSSIVLMILILIKQKYCKDKLPSNEPSHNLKIMRSNMISMRSNMIFAMLNMFFAILIPTVSIIILHILKTELAISLDVTYASIFSCALLGALAIILEIITALCYLCYVKSAYEMYNDDMVEQSVVGCNFEHLRDHSSATWPVLHQSYINADAESALDNKSEIVPDSNDCRTNYDAKNPNTTMENLQPFSAASHEDQSPPPPYLQLYPSAPPI